MAKVFVDANYFIGLANKAPEVDAEILHSHISFISILSCHILFYINKVKTPNKETSAYISDFNLIGLNKKILSKSLIGPTKDLEDNIQLHSASKARCAYFLTKDKALLKLGFFDKIKILSEI